MNLLPLPVSIEKADRMIEGSGADIGDEIVVFDWFSVEDSQDKEAAHLIADLIDAMVTALNEIPGSTVEAKGTQSKESQSRSETKKADKQ